MRPVSDGLYQRYVGHSLLYKVQRVQDLHRFRRAYGISFGQNPERMRARDPGGIGDAVDAERCRNGVHKPSSGGRMGQDDPNTKRRRRELGAVTDTPSPASAPPAFRDSPRRRQVAMQVGANPSRTADPPPSRTVGQPASG